MEITIPSPSTITLKTKAATAAILFGDENASNLKSDILLDTNAGDSDSKRTTAADFSVDSPGEFEYGGMAILGLDTMHSTHEKVSYRVNVSGLNSVFLDDTVTNLDDNSLEQLGTIDLLFIPIGANSDITPAVASKLVRACDPTYLIPVPVSKSDNSVVDEWLKKDFASNEAIQEEVFKLKPADTNEIFKIIKLY